MATISKGVDKKLTGPEKAAVVMMSVNQDISAKIFSQLSEDEIRDISHAMTNLGQVDQSIIEAIITEFSDEISTGANVVGDIENTKRVLGQALGEERVGEILDELRGPMGRNTWEKLNNVNEELLAGFLKNEYPQTVALVLSKIKPGQASRVLSVLPEDFALDVIRRMISLEPVKNEVLSGIERTLQNEFMTNLSDTKESDSFELVADVFNNFDRNTEKTFLEALDGSDPDSAEKIRDLMFTFEDLLKLDDASIQTLLRVADKDQLPIALKGATDELRDHFFKNMSERAVKILQEDMESQGPVRLKDVDAAQMTIVNAAKDLADQGEIKIPEEDDDEELIY